MDYVVGKEVYTLEGEVALDEETRTDAINKFIGKVLKSSGLTDEEIQDCSSLNSATTSDELIVNRKKITPSLDKLVETLTKDEPQAVKVGAR